ncbi:MAG: hypothetical protein V3T31_04290, partial [candidate division Zixibacteria bacterium]
PYRFEFSDFAGKIKDSVSFAIRNVGEETLEISSVSQPSEYWEISLPESVEAGGEVHGYIKATAQALKTAFEESITLLIKPERSPEFRITVPIRSRLYEL